MNTFWHLELLNTDTHDGFLETNRTEKGSAHKFPVRQREAEWSSRRQPGTTNYEVAVDREQVSRSSVDSRKALLRWSN
jgi:hypothetical protein